LRPHAGARVRLEPGHHIAVVTLGRRTRRSVAYDREAASRPASCADDLLDSGTDLGQFQDVPTAQLTVHRTSAEDVKERELYVGLDGKRVAVLEYGETMTIPVTSGPHRLRVHNTLFWKTIEFIVKPGQHVRFRAVNVPGGSFFLMALFIGCALMYVVLEREPDGPRDWSIG